MQPSSWTDELKTRFQDHQTAVDPALWEGIRTALPASTLVGRGTWALVRRRVLWTASVAAVAVAGLWVGTRFQHPAQGPAVALLPPPALAVEADPGLLPRAQALAQVLPQARKARPEAPVATAPQEGEWAVANVGTTNVGKENEGNEAEGGQQTAQQAAEKPAQKPAKVWSPQVWEPQTPARHKAFSLSMKAAGGVTGNVLGTVDGMSAGLEAADGVYATPSSLAKRNDAPLTEEELKEQIRNSSSFRGTDEEMPVSLGLSLRWTFREQWALESGLQYTVLRTRHYDQHPKGEARAKEQIRYLGLPVYLSYTLLDNGRLSLYLSAGGTLDRLVAVHRMEQFSLQNGKKTREHTTEHLPVWQTSVSAHMGLQYNLTPRLGIYGELGVSHFFNDGSRLHTFYETDPTLLHAAAGLRFALQ